MALEQITFNIGAFNDANAGGNNYYVGTVFRVKKQSDGAFAFIYSDAAGDFPISQNDIDNVSNSIGECNFYIEAGNYYIEVGSSIKNFTVGSSASEILVENGGTVQDYISSNTTPFDTVADMVSATYLAGLSEDTLIQWGGYYIKGDGGGNYGLLKFGAHTADGGSVFSVDSNTYIKSDISSGCITASKFGVVGDGSESDKTQIENAFSFCGGNVAKFIIDVEGVYNPMFFVDGLNVHVTKKLTLKGNPSTVDQGIFDCLFTTSCTGFSLTFEEGTEHTSEEHGTWQEFSHFIRCQNAYHGYIGKHVCDKFDGDGIFWSQSSDVTIDSPTATRPGRSGMSIIENIERCTLNNPHCEGIHPSPLSDDLGCLNIEPNKAGNMDITINHPTGYGDEKRVTGLQIFLEKNFVNESNYERYVYNVQVNNPAYNRCLINYNFKNFFWKENTTGNYIAPRGSITIVDSACYNPLDKGYNIDSVLSKGGIELNIVRPTLTLTLPTDGDESSQSNNMFVVTRNQAVYTDPDKIPCTNISDIMINDKAGYAHNSYVFVRYGEGLNTCSFNRPISVEPSTPLIVYPETGAGSLVGAEVKLNSKELMSISASKTLEQQDCLYTITNTGASGNVTLTLPVTPINSEIEFINTKDNATLSIAPPTSGIGIGSGSLGASYDILPTERYKAVRFKRVNSSRYSVS